MIPCLRLWLALRRACTQLPALATGFLLILPALAATVLLRPAAASAAAAPATATAPSMASASLADWLQACGKLPPNRALAGRLPPRTSLPLQRFGDFRAVLDRLLTDSSTGALAQSSHWTGTAPSPRTFLNPAAAWFVNEAVPFEPFAQKLVLPAGSEVFLHGDLHGDVHSLNACLAWLNANGYLTDFTVARTNFHMVFLGDYTDRGLYGVETLFALMRLKLANPDRVWLVRGNHEEAAMIAQYGFVAEGRAKYGTEFDPVRISRLYDFLPTVLYLGCGTQFAQCNHGGMEPGYDPRPLLGTPAALQYQFLGELKQRAFLEASPGWPDERHARTLMTGYYQDFVPASPVKPTVLGFMWNDFTVARGEPQFAVDPGRAFVYGDRAVAHILHRHSAPAAQLVAVFRAHQHSGLPTPLMRRLVAARGLFRHWQDGDTPSLLEAPVRELERIVETSPERPVPAGSVWTFNVSPDSVYGQGNQYTFDTFGLLRLADKLEDWRLRVINLGIGPSSRSP